MKKVGPLMLYTISSEWTALSLFVFKLFIRHEDSQVYFHVIDQQFLPELSFYYSFFAIDAS